MKSVYALLALTALPLSSAWAADGHIYSGMTCHDSAPSYTSYGRRFSSATVTAAFDCPVLKDSLDQSMYISDIHVWAIDLSTTNSVTCSIWSLYQSGSSVYLWSGASAYPASAGTPSTFTSSAPQKLTFTGSLGNVSATTQSNWYHLQCWIPSATATGNSGISSYFIDENT